MSSCLLCRSGNVRNFYKDKHQYFLKCADCSTIFRDPKNFISRKAEFERYLTHNNDINDKGYQNFVAPIVSAVNTDFHSDAVGLDFGAGTGPVIAKLLTASGYKIELYDPFFHPDNKVLNDRYDFIVCCEVIEHFHDPIKEFHLLKSLLKPDGKLYCMTDPYDDKRTFSDWYYKDDPTHVLFYTEENLEYIRASIGFSEMRLDGRLIVFT